MRYLLILSLVFSFGFGDNLSLRLDKLILDKSVKKVTILEYNPFFIKQTKRQIKKNDFFAPAVIKKQKLRLITILNNKAFINNRWLGIQEKISGFVVKKISKNSVTLIKKHRKVVLRFQESKDILKVRKK